MAPPPSSHEYSPGQRTLAAIVFTDVVGFSARMQRDEATTLKLLDRDFAEMRRLCAEHEGAVLKTTGDGLLLTFSSAVHAVACALAMQRQFAAEAKSQPAAGEPLQHRIGIHIGDIMVQNQDVMGDGVNIASRLQAEAEPGGICISQTVYDVVKNKLEMQAVSIGARELKNISQAVPVYRILLEAEALRSSDSRPPLASAGARAAAGSRRGIFFAAGAVVLLAVVFVAGMLISRRSPAPASPAAAAPAPQAAAVAAPPAASQPVTAGTVATAAITDEEFEREFTRRKEQMQQMRTQYLDKYDFDGLVRALREKGDTSTGRAGAQTMLHSAELMLKMREWLEFVLARYTRQRPLPVHDLSGDTTKDIHVLLTPDRRLVVIENGVSKPHEWSELKPPVIGAIIVSAMHETKPPATREVIMGAQAFARFYTLPPMQEALAGIGRGRGGAK